MILLSLKGYVDIALCGGGKWARDWTHPGVYLIADRYTDKQHETGGTYSWDMTWVCVDARRDVYRHHGGTFGTIEVAEGKKRTLIDQEVWRVHRICK